MIHVYIPGTEINLCIKCEASRTNDVVGMDKYKKVEM